jgi:hypothetical protein
LSNSRSGRRITPLAMIPYACMTSSLPMMTPRSAIMCVMKCGIKNMSVIRVYSKDPYNLVFFEIETECSGCDNGRKFL